jgi:hypothetical protein
LNATGRAPHLGGARFVASQYGDHTMTKPHFAASAETEAVRLLATVTRQFLSDRASRKDVAEAVALWQEVVSINSDSK